jgi:hypothetical protein
MEAYHMLKENAADYELYKKKLLELGFLLDKLGKISRVIWLNQYPTIDFFGKTDDRNADIHTQKIHGFNEAVRRIFKWVTEF